MMTYMPANAVILADDKTRSIFFDSIQSDDNLHSQPEDLKPCFDRIKLPDAIKDTSYDPFLSSMAQIKLHKSQNAFNTASYLRLAYNVNRTLKPKTVKQQSIDPKVIQPCLAFLPLDTIKRTLECTTQLVKWHTRVPLQRHWKPHFPHLNVHQLMEPVATDTFFANCKP